MRSDPCAIGLRCLAFAVFVSALPAANAGAPFDPPAAPGPSDAPTEDPTPFAIVAPPQGEGCTVRRGNSDAAWLLLGPACLVLARRRARYGLIS